MKVGVVTKGGRISDEIGMRCGVLGSVLFQYMGVVREQFCQYIVSILDGFGRVCGGDGYNMLCRGVWNVIWGCLWSYCVVEGVFVGLWDNDVEFCALGVGGVDPYFAAEAFNYEAA